MIGRMLGHYRIEEELGKGGMGVVYKAHDTHLDRPVAIKVLVASAVADPERKRRFAQEARTASALNHPNILHIYDIGQAEGTDFIAMEYVAGKTLDQSIGERGLPVSEVLHYGVQIAGALARAHAAGVVHRDIKPANLMVAEGGLIKVLDFGLAKLAEPAVRTDGGDITATLQAGSPHTEAGAIVGTIAYMSPEQAEGKKVDARSDIFSFGAVLYEMLTGRQPFEGESKLAVLSAILSHDPKPLRASVALAPVELEQVVGRCLRKDPKLRFQQMSEVQTALEQLRQPGSRMLASQMVRRAMRFPFRHKWTAAALAVLGAALLVALATGLRQRLGFNRSPSDQLVAVLAFKTAGDDADSQAFGEGLVHTMARALAGLDQYQRRPRVVPPAYLAGEAERSAAEARKTAGVRLALTGTIERRGGAVRWSAVVLDATSLRELRRRTLDLPAGDVAALRHGLARSVAEMVDLEFPSAADRVLAIGSTRVPAAYEAYLQGYGYLRRNRSQDLERAVRRFETALEKDRSFTLARAALAEAWWASSTLTKDQPAAEKARLAAEQVLSQHADLPAVRVLLGNIYSGTGRPEQAMAEYQRALEIDPQFVEAHLRLATALESAGRLRDAEAAYRWLIELRPDFYFPVSSLGAFYVRSGRYAEAESALRKVVRFVPENAVGHSNLGGVYHFLGREAEAAAAFKRSLEIKPTAAAYTNLGTLYFFQGRYSDAVPLMEKAVELQPDSSLYWGNLGDGYRWAPERKAKAAEAYRRAIQFAEKQLAVNPNNADLRSSVAVYYAKLPQPEKALAQIALARRLAPTRPRVLFKAALVYELTGRRQQALGALQIATESGYSIQEVRSEPELAGLRKDPRYPPIERAAGSPRPAP